MRPRKSTKRVRRKKVKPLVQYVGFVRDHSASMKSLTTAAMNDYNINLATLKENADEKDIDTFVSVVKCGVGPRGEVQLETANTPVGSMRPLNYYTADGYYTPLFDSVGKLIELFEEEYENTKRDVEASFLIIAVTDGEDNRSPLWKNHIANDIAAFQATDRWTFVFRVPHGYANELKRLGVPQGNIQEWEQTEQGMQDSSHITAQAVSSYYSGRTRGVKSTRSFYANMGGVTSANVKAVMTNISAEVRIWPVKNGGEMIRPFVERKLRKIMPLGSAFYQLTKPEKAVQDYKMIIIRSKKTGAVYAGQSARDLLELPTDGTIKLAPGDHGGYDIYIQSTSVNRKLIAGTNVLYWKNDALLAKAARGN